MVKVYLVFRYSSYKTAVINCKFKTVFTANILSSYLVHIQIYYLEQWSSRCAPVYTSLHRNYFTGHRNFKMVK